LIEGSERKMTLARLKRIVLEKGKVPAYHRRHGDVRISTVLDKEGLHTFIFGGELPFEHHLKPFDEVTENDVSALVEALGEESIEEILGVEE